MIEIVCPNCEARYQLPEGSIGPGGRKVSCSSCAHKWRAHPEGAEDTAPPAAAAPAAPPPRERTPEEAMAAMAASESASAPSAATPPPASGNRDEQMAAIRRMLSDLKEAADTVPDRSDGAEEERKRPEPAPAAPGPSARRRDDDGPSRDKLDSHIDDVDKLAKMVKGEPTGEGYDAAKLRKRHEKRAKRLQKARERRKKSGAFLTGFTLVATVSAVMVGLYVMHPQIIAAQPEMEPALVEYVTTVDRYRVEFSETTADWREWLTERIANLTDEEKKP